VSDTHPGREHQADLLRRLARTNERLAELTALFEQVPADPLPISSVAHTAGSEAPDRVAHVEQPLTRAVRLAAMLPAPDEATGDGVDRLIQRLTLRELTSIARLLRSAVAEIDGVLQSEDERRRVLSGEIARYGGDEPGPAPRLDDGRG
jgi:hypothetical protein